MLLLQNMEFVDTHTHNYDEMYPEAEQDAVIERALAAGVKILIQADISSHERASMLSLADRHPDCLRIMAGLYPGSVGDDWRDEVAAVEQTLRERKAVAVGEIGLDYHYGADTAQLQKEAFRVQLELAHEHDLPVNIHLRDATEDFFSILQDCRHLHLRGNLHAFGGSAETFRRLERLGDWYVGIGGTVTFKNASVARSVTQIPMERILLETDAPYLAPVPYRGSRNESAHIPVIAAKIAELKGLPLGEVARISTENAERLFAL